MTTCASCSAAVDAGARFCRTCGARIATGEISQPVTSVASQRPPRLNSLGFILLALTGFIYYSEPFGHFFTQLSCQLSDGSTYDCGRGEVANPHVLSAVVMLLAAISAFAAHVWLKRRMSAANDAPPPWQKYAVYATIAALIGSSWMLGQVETHRSQWNSDVGRMATFLERANIPGVQGGIEQLDSGGQQYFATAPLRNSDLTEMCQTFLGAIARINSSHRAHPVRTAATSLTECTQQLGEVRGAPAPGDVYPIANYFVHGSYRPSTSHRDVAFIAGLGLCADRGSNPTTPFPTGYQWNISLRAE